MNPLIKIINKLVFSIPKFSMEKTTFGKPEEDCQRLRGRGKVWPF
jgi:hypothetical protein